MPPYPSKDPRHQVSQQKGADEPIGEQLIEPSAGLMTSRLPPTLSIVIPCYRSEATLGSLLDQLHSGLKGSDYEVILVVDGSPDATWELVSQLAEHPRVRGVNLMRNYGQHNAVLAGILESRNEVIITMDDDLQHPPTEIARLVDALTPEFDLVYGVAEAEEHGVLRSASSRLVKAAMALTLDFDHAQSISAFRAFRRELIEPLRALPDAFVSIDVCLSWTTTRVTSIPVPMARREDGQSNYTFRSLVTHAVNMVTGYSSRPLRMMSYLGVGMASLGLGLFVYVLILFFSGSTEVAGFTTLASMVAMFAGAQMLALGIMGEYLGRLHFRSMHRPAFVIRERSGDRPPGMSDVRALHDVQGVEGSQGDESKSGP